MNIREAAAELDTTPKILRRILRRSPGFGGVGIGGIYDLTPSQVEALRAVVPAKSESKDPYPELDQDQGFDPSLLHQMRYNPKIRAEVLARRKARESRLKNRLEDPRVATFIAESQRELRKSEENQWLPVNN